MGSDDGGSWILRPQTEPLIQGFESEAPGGPALSFKEWTSLRKFVEVLGGAELVSGKAASVIDNAFVTRLLETLGFAIVSCLPQEIKADVLRHLFHFLSSSAATIKYSSPTSAENASLSAFVGDTEVYVDYDELVTLHDLLLLELARRVPLFSTDNEKFAQSHSAFPTTLQGLKVAALTLRCCLRLLPLIELFDTGLRNAMGVDLDNLLQKLCSPTEPCLLPAKVHSSDVITSNIEPFRAPLLCALLEVFVDELLCHSNAKFLLVQNGISEKGTRSSSRLTLEAILAHVMISAQAPKGPHEPRTRPCELSLQSAVMLLDRVITDNAPRYLLSHVVRIVSQGLEDSTCTTENLHASATAENQKKWFSRFPISSYSSNAKSCEVNTNSVPDSLSRQVSFWLVSSVLERGVSLYMDYASAPHLANFVSVLDDGPQPPAAVSNTLLASSLWNYVCHRGRLKQECETALESMLNDATLRKGLEECMDQTYCSDQVQFQGHAPGQGADRILKAGYLDGSIERSSGTYFCGGELYNVPVWEEDHSTLIADVLHLMHSALNFITENVRSMEETCRDSLTANMSKEDIDDIWLGLIGSFHKCLPCTGEITVVDSVGHVLVFFTDMLFYEAETTISDNRLREYLELLESLVISLLTEHFWRESTSNPQLPVQKYGQKGNMDADSRWEAENETKTSPSFYARRVVSLLQGFLEEPDLLEILGANAVSIVLQISCFWNDFCEFMDKVLSTHGWREYIPANGRRIARKILNPVHGADTVDRNVVEENFDHDMQFLEELPSPDEREFRPHPAEVAPQQSEDDYTEPAEHPPCPVNTRMEKQQLRNSTLSILQRLMKHRNLPKKPLDASPDRKLASGAEVTATRRARPVRKCRQKTENETFDIPTEAEGNPFVAEVLLLEKTSENFDDLNDFIVCKQGRSYTRWLNRRTKFRRRKRTREIWKRSEEKRRLFSMLHIG